MQFKFRGLMAPVFTPFDKDGNEINLEIIPQYAKYLHDNGIHGILVNGTTGEGPSLCMSERVLLAERWAAACKVTKQTVMVQIGGAPMPQVLQMAKLADSKVDALLCLPDLYFRPTSVKELIRYLAAVGKAAPNTPLLYYHIPSFTNVDINMAEFLEEAHKTNAIPTLAGIKFTSSNLIEGSSCLVVGGGCYAVFLGADQIMSAACSLGFDSGIATTLNFAPNYAQEIFQSFSRGQIKMEQLDIKIVKDAQAKLTELVNMITQHGTWVSSMKAAMNVISPINVGPVREPLLQLTPEQITELHNDFTKHFK